MDFYQRAKRYSIEKFTTRENRITDAWHQFQSLHGVTEYINLSDMVSINNGWSRWQRYNENGFSGSF